jgi:hypothetical protein
MIFVQPILDNFVDNPLSHTLIMFLLSLSTTLFLLFLSQKKYKQKGCPKVVKYLVVQISE